MLYKHLIHDSLGNSGQKKSAHRGSSTDDDLFPLNNINVRLRNSSMPGLTIVSAIQILILHF